jgi:DNA modification methylase
MNNLPEIRLYCEDCVTGIPVRVGKDYVDLVVTSPPYNLGVKIQHLPGYPEVGGVSRMDRSMGFSCKRCPKG